MNPMHFILTWSRSVSLTCLFSEYWLVLCSKASSGQWLAWVSTVSPLWELPRVFTITSRLLWAFTLLVSFPSQLCPLTGWSSHGWDKRLPQFLCCSSVGLLNCGLPKELPDTEWIANRTEERKNCFLIQQIILLRNVKFQYIVAGKRELS